MNLAIGLCVSIVLQLIVSIFVFFFYGMQAYLIWASCACVLISGIYIIFDLKMILERGATDPEDYIMAALTLYVDLMRLFYHLLILFASRRN